MTLGRLFLLFTLVPLLEVWLLVQIGGIAGVLPTIALVAATGIAGATLIRREGRKALLGWQEALGGGHVPEDGILGGLLIVLAGVLLVTPGVLTDVVGMLLLIPPLRRRVAARLDTRLRAKLTEGMQRGPFHIDGFTPSGAPRPSSFIDVEAHEPD